MRSRWLEIMLFKAIMVNFIQVICALSLWAQGSEKSDQKPALYS
jgi:hypothetical protein